MNCAKCHRLLFSPRKTAKCSICKTAFHPFCTRIQTMENFKNMTADERGKWMCDTCHQGAIDLVDLRCSSDRDSDDPTPEAVIEQLSLGSKIEMLLRKFAILDGKLDSVGHSMGFFEDQFEDMKKDLSSLRATVEEIVTESGTLHEEHQELKGTVRYLTDKLNDLDQYLLSTTLEVKGIPQRKKENLHEILKTLARKIKAPFEDRDVESVSRIRSSTKSSATDSNSSKIVIKFSNTAIRNMWLKQMKVNRNIKAKDLNINFPETEIFINERLTAANDRLFWHVRKFARQHQYKFAWTVDGRMFLRKDSSAKPIRIFDFNQLATMDAQEQLRPSTPVAAEEI
uniref:Zinc finger PHD-type domain-containing protein n=1 Tax=Lygus hesperus TaxID=30085 RepID=A0A0K8ST40_LYGHE